MSILNLQLGTAGADNIVPRICYINTNNTIAEVTATGYLNQAVQEGAAFLESDICLVTTKASASAAIAVGWYEISKSGANTSLIVPSSASTIIGNLTVTGSVTAGTGFVATTGGFTATAGNIAASAGSVSASTTVTGGTGVVATTGNIVATAGNLVAGSSGNQGTVSAFPAGALAGSLVLSAIGNTGNTAVTISNAIHGQATVYSLPDVGAATGGIVVSTTQFVMKSVAGAAAAGGAVTQSFTDTFCTAGSNVIGNWNTQTNAAQVLKIEPGVGSFVVTSSADAGAGTFNYIITK